MASAVAYAPNALTQAPEHSRYYFRNRDPLKILDDWATEKNLRGFPLENAQALLCGKQRQLLVLGWEPCNLADKVAYEHMVRGNPEASEDTVERHGSATLQEVDRIIRQVAPGQSLESIPFTDLNILLSESSQEQSVDKDKDLCDAHETLIKIVKAQQPDVILIITCMARNSKNEDVKRKLRSSLYTAGNLDIQRIWGRDILLVKGFHPSSYLRKDYIKKNKYSKRDITVQKDMLEFCFEMAFGACRGKQLEDPDLMERWQSFLTSRKGDGPVTPPKINKFWETKKIEKLAELALKSHQDAGIDSITSGVRTMTMNDPTGGFLK